MAFGFSKTRFSPIAIDFGADSLKLLQIIPGDPPQLVAAATAVIPEEARNDAAAREAFLSDSLRRLLKSQPFKGRRAICSLPAFQTLVQHLEIARVDGEDIHAQIGMQLRQRLNIDPNRMVVRHFPLGQVVRDGTPRQEVLCLAASRDVVMRYIDLVSRCKLDVVGMHSEPLAILRAFEHLGGEDNAAQQAVCFIDIGAATTKVVIAHGRELAFAKTIHAAGDLITRRLAVTRQIGFADARALRVAEAEGGAAPTPSAAPRPAPGGATGLAILDARTPSDSGGGPSETAPPHEAAARNAGSMASGGTSGGTSGGGGDEEDTLECLIDELQMCVRYHQSLFPKRPIEKLIFLGGESRHVQTCQRIARAVRIAAQLGDPLARVTRIGAKPATGADLNQPQPGWAVPFGLCLSEANL